MLLSLCSNSSIFSILFSSSINLVLAQHSNYCISNLLIIAHSFLNAKSKISYVTYWLGTTVFRYSIESLKTNKKFFTSLDGL